VPFAGLRVSVQRQRSRPSLQKPDGAGDAERSRVGSPARSPRWDTPGSAHKGAGILLNISSSFFLSFFWVGGRKSFEQTFLVIEQRTLHGRQIQREALSSRFSDRACAIGAGRPVGSRCAAVRLCSWPDLFDLPMYVLLQQRQHCSCTRMRQCKFQFLSSTLQLPATVRVVSTFR